MGTHAVCSYTACVPSRSRLITALTLSFSVYLVPIVTVHWVGLLGPALAEELFQDREPAWKAADVTLALILQAVLFACVWWVVPRS